MTEKEALFFRKRMRELCDSCFQRDIPVHSRFLNAEEQAVLQSMHLGGGGVQVVLTGGFEDAERRIACFLPEYLSEPPEDLLCCLRISPAAPKFAESLSHRDYLGALMNLGMEREMLGDLAVDPEGAWLVMLPELADTVLEGLSQVRRTAVRVRREELSSLRQVRRTETDSVNTASLRVDALLSAVFGVSRGTAKELVQAGKVFLNSAELTDSSRLLKEGEILSVRGKGRFRFLGESRSTRKGRMFVDIERFV